MRLRPINAPIIINDLTVKEVPIYDFLQIFIIFYQKLAFKHCSIL
jgi:hypothetical protein